MGEVHRIRKNIFEELIIFNNKFMFEMSIYRTCVSGALDGANEILKPTFSGANECLLNGNDYLCNDKRLTEAQKNAVSRYVNGLGLSENASLNNLKLYNEQFRIEERQEEKKYLSSGKVYSKLGLSLGLIFIILVV